MHEVVRQQVEESSSVICGALWKMPQLTPWARLRQLRLPPKPAAGPRLTLLRLDGTRLTPAPLNRSLLHLHQTSGAQLLMWLFTATLVTLLLWQALEHMQLQCCNQVALPVLVSGVQ